MWRLMTPFDTSVKCGYDFFLFFGLREAKSVAGANSPRRGLERCTGRIFRICASSLKNCDQKEKPLEICKPKVHKLLAKGKEEA